MKLNLFNSAALVIFLVNGNFAWGLDKASVYDVASGARPTIAADNTGGLHIAYENSISYEVAKAVRDSQGHLHSVEGSSLVIPGIWYSQSGIGGEDKWANPISIPGLAGSSQQPDIAIEKNNIVDLVFTGNNSNEGAADIFFTRSIDGGHAWSQPVDIATTPGQSSEPAVAVAPDGSLHVIWSDTSRGEEHKDIFYSYSKDGGKTWGKNPLLPADNISSTSGRSTQPAIAISADGAIHVAWLDSTPSETHPDIFYSYKLKDVWSEPLNLSHSSRMSSHPGIACGTNGKIYIVWSDNSRKEEAADIWCAISNQYGDFGTPLNISNTYGVASEPAIAANKTGDVIIVWSDTSNTPNKPDIYCRISNNNGTGFSNVIPLSHSAGVNKHPNVTIAGKTMVAVWEETDGASKQIKLSSMELKNLAMGPVLKIEPSLNMRAGR